MKRSIAENKMGCESLAFSEGKIQEDKGKCCTWGIVDGILV